MSKVVKQMELDALTQNLGGVRDMVLLTSTRVDASLDYNFRKGLREKNVRLQMVKNTLARKVLEGNGVKVDGVWEGTTLIAWGPESVKDLSKAVDAVLKKAVVEGAKKGLDEGLRFESKCFGEVCGLEDMRIGMDNFMKNGPKARAEFKNR